MLYLSKTHVIRLHSREKYSLPFINEGLSKFYDRKIVVDASNFDYFSGDILALFFGFEQPSFSCYINGVYFADFSNNMQEFIFHVNQSNPKSLISKIKQL